MPRLHGYTKKALIELYTKMVTARRSDEKMMILLRQGKAFFLTSCAGHEVAQLAAAQNIKPGVDWSYVYYRDAAFVLGLGTTSREHLLSFLAKKDDPDSGGRPGLPAAAPFRSAGRSLSALRPVLHPPFATALRH